MCSKKFSEFDSIELREDEIPKTAYLAYAVCAGEDDSCGWKGWILEAVYSKEKKQVSLKGDLDTLVAADNQKCPNCSKLTYRTGIQKVFIAEF